MGWLVWLVCVGLCWFGLKNNYFQLNFEFGTLETYRNTHGSAKWRSEAYLDTLLPLMSIVLSIIQHYLTLIKMVMTQSNAVASDVAEAIGHLRLI